MFVKWPINIPSFIPRKTDIYSLKDSERGILLGILLGKFHLMEREARHIADDEAWE